MNEVATQQTTADPWGAYAEATATSNGDYLAFKKGFFKYGQDNHEMAMDTILIFNMDEFKTGWQRWNNKKPADEKMVRVVTGLAPTPRDQLGYLDELKWEDDIDFQTKKPKKDPDTGTVLKKDPWQKVSTVPCVDESGKQYTFTAGSVTAMQALGKLCGAYGKEVAQHPDDHPRVKINKDSYMSDDYGEVYFPTFEIVGWIDKNESSDTSADAAATAQVEDKTAPVVNAQDTGATAGAADLANDSEF